MQRIRRLIRVPKKTPRRQGFTTPAVATALLVIMMGLALIIDRIWLETAKLELKTASEAAALAAAAELASDTLLLPSVSVDLRLNNARQTAAWIAEQNYVGGIPVNLNIEPEGDIRFGYLYQDSLGVRFEESTTNPNTVVVTALRTRSNNNPVALFISGATGLPFADVAVRVEATVSNDVVGLRPIEGSPIPALPIAILQSDPSGQRSDTWNNLIEAAQGADLYSWDTETNTVVSGPDGIPEIVLNSLQVGGQTSSANVLLLDLGTGIVDLGVTRQIQSGISVEDLESLDENLQGELWVGQGSTLSLTGTPKLDGAVESGLQNLIGERRVCFLYSTTVAQRQSPLFTATCPQAVGIRIMAVNGSSSGVSSVTVQPTVMTLRTAMLASESLNTVTPAVSDSLEDNISTSLTSTLPNSLANSIANTSNTIVSNVIPNRYLYKLRLTH